MCENATKSMEFKHGTTVESKYLLPSINVSVKVGEKSKNVTSVTASLARMLNFYNTEQLTANWKTIQKKLTVSCRKDMDLYLDGLHKAENWALKSKINMISLEKLARLYFLNPNN